MTNKIVITPYRDFDKQYGGFPLQGLNNAWAERGYSNTELGFLAGEATHAMNPVTQDDYVWFGSLQYGTPKGRVAVLFPTKFDMDHPSSPLDRSVGIYADQGVSSSDISRLVLDLMQRLTTLGASGTPKEEAA